MTNRISHRVLWLWESHKIHHEYGKGELNAMANLHGNALNTAQMNGELRLLMLVFAGWFTKVGHPCNLCTKPYLAQPCTWLPYMLQEKFNHLHSLVMGSSSKRSLQTFEFFSREKEQNTQTSCCTAYLLRERFWCPSFNAESPTQKARVFDKTGIFPHPISSHQRAY